MRHIILFLFGLAVSCLALKYLPAPYVWLFFIWCALSFLGMTATRREFPRVALFNIGAILLTLALFETTLLVVENLKPRGRRWEGTYKKGYFINHDLLGYGPKPNMTVTSRVYHRRTLIYDVVYTIDENGLRVSPPTNIERPIESIIFFGGSYTFGQGVNDEETMPYQVGVLSGRKYLIRNFGFHGYGPHQMLAGLEFGIVDSCLQETKPRFAIYQLRVGHALRSAGLTSWDKFGPKYVQNSEGIPVYRGAFSNRENELPVTISSWLTWQLFKSTLARKLLFRKPSINKAHIDLLFSIVESSKDIVETRFPGCRFHVILWDTDNKYCRQLREKLQSREINLHLVSDIIPDIKANRGKYILSEYDAHPNALLHKIIAQYVVRHILKHADAYAQPNSLDKPL